MWTTRPDNQRLTVDPRRSNRVVWRLDGRLAVLKAPALEVPAFDLLSFPQIYVAAPQMDAGCVGLSLYSRSTTSAFTCIDPVPAPRLMRAITI